MRTRGAVYWDWADPMLHVRSVDERLPDGTLLNVLVRMSTSGEVQLFVGVYTVNGVMLFEEAFYERPGETMTKAMDWGLKRAKEQAPNSTNQPAERAGARRLPRAGSRQAK